MCGNGVVFDLMCDVFNVLSIKSYAKIVVVEAWVKLGDIIEVVLDDFEKGEYVNVMYV